MRQISLTEMQAKRALSYQRQYVTIRSSIEGYAFSHHRINIALAGRIVLCMPCQTQQDYHKIVVDLRQYTYWEFTYEKRTNEIYEYSPIESQCIIF